MLSKFWPNCPSAGPKRQHNGKTLKSNNCASAFSPQNSACSIVLGVLQQKRNSFSLPFRPGLAGVLRVADGLDRTHRSVVVDLACRTPPGLIEVTCATHTYAEEERLEALDKGRLLERVLDRQLIVDWRVVGQ